MGHEDAGERCLLIHRDGQGQCVKCKKCRQWIRPSEMGEDCPAAGADGAANYAPGCIHIDIKTGHAYRNAGTAASARFLPVR